jgi:hypothetical protein
MGISEAKAATGSDSLDALAKAKGFGGFGSSAGGGAPGYCGSVPQSAAAWLEDL